MTIRRALLAVCLVAGLAVAPGCGSSTRVQATAAHGSASMASVRTARCHQWNQMDAADRTRLLRGMKTFFGGVVDDPGMRGQVLSADRATRVFDGFCKQSYAGMFALYRLYGDAAAFTPPTARAQ